jgi:hypothetical protein
MRTSPIVVALLLVGDGNSARWERFALASRADPAERTDRRGIDLRRLITIALCAGLLSGCATARLGSDGQLNTADLMRRVKDELAEYYFYMHQHENDPAAPDVCGGRIRFDIKSVTVTLTSQSDDSADVNGSASIPIGGPGTLGPSLDASRDAKSTTMKYTIFPVDPGPGKPTFRTGPQWAGFPIASSIEQLRESLLEASDTPPCVHFAPRPTVPPDPKGVVAADQTVSFDFTVVRTVKGGAAFKFLLFSAGATASHQAQAGNTISVVFNASKDDVGFVGR